MITNNDVEIIVSGDRALFARPEFKRDDVSYDIITPFAARGILDAVHWRPAIRWVVDEIRVLEPIVFQTSSLDRRQMRTALQHVRHRVRAHFEFTSRAGPHDEPERHRGMFRRQLRHGAPVYLGTEDCPGMVSLADRACEDIPLAVSADLGWILHDVDHEDRGRLRFFRAVMVEGVVRVPPPGSASILG